MVVNLAKTVVNLNRAVVNLTRAEVNITGALEVCEIKNLPEQW